MKKLAIIAFAALATSAFAGGGGGGGGGDTCTECPEIVIDGKSFQAVAATSSLFMNLANGTARRLVKKDQVFNRIRVEDIASATAFLAGPKTGGIFNVTDDIQAKREQLIDQLTQRMTQKVQTEHLFTLQWTVA